MADTRVSPRESEEPSKPSVAGVPRSGQAQVLVAVRVRPLTSKEKSSGAISKVKVMDRKLVVVADPFNDENDVLRGHRVRDRKYAFDYAFDEEVSQEEVYELTTKFLVDGVLHGYNATVFAYGATGTGKTHTMIGPPDDPGIMVLTLKDMFERLKHDAAFGDYNYRVSFSYLEVYNENIRDLLTPSNTFLDLREDPVKGMCVAGIQEVEARSHREVMELLRRGNRHRTQEATSANVYSSRSHAVLQVTVEQKEKTPNIVTPVRVGKLSLIDLAGSERAAKTKNMGKRMIEGANINRSLLALGNCINALGDKANRGAYVPFRDSKLTRLLKDSLGGNCRTTMIATASPAEGYLEETVNTLKYANRAKNIQLSIAQNVSSVSHHIAQYTQIIADLRLEISALKQALAKAKEGAAEGLGPGDGQEGETLQRLRNDLVASFQDRLQLRRSLLDLEELQANNSNEATRLERLVQRWQEENPGVATMEAPKEVRLAKMEAQSLRTNMDKNSQLKESLTTRISEADAVAAKQQKEFPKMVQSSDRKGLLELEFRMHLLELQNMELEEHTLMRADVIRQSDMRIVSLMEQIRLRDEVIERQRIQLESLGAPEDPSVEELALKIEDAEDLEPAGAYTLELPEDLQSKADKGRRGQAGGEDAVAAAQRAIANSTPVPGKPKEAAAAAGASQDTARSRPPSGRPVSGRSDGGGSTRTSQALSGLRDRRRRSLVTQAKELKESPVPALPVGGGAVPAAAEDGGSDRRPESSPGTAAGTPRKRLRGGGGAAAADGGEGSSGGEEDGAPASGAAKGRSGSVSAGVRRSVAGQGVSHPPQSRSTGAGVGRAQQRQTALGKAQAQRAGAAAGPGRAGSARDGAAGKDAKSTQLKSIYGQQQASAHAGAHRRVRAKPLAPQQRDLNASTSSASSIDH